MCPEKLIKYYDMLYSLKMILKTGALSMVLGSMMLLLLIVPAVSTGSSTSIGASGTISYGPTINITVDFGNQVMTNAFGLGTQINDYRWYLIAGSQELRDACKALNLRYMREYTVGRFQPCKSWDPSTNTGTYDWRNFDALVEFMLWCGAEPIITIESAGISGMTGAGLSRLPDSKQFGIHCQNLIRHCNEKGYGIKYYDLANEPYFYYTPQQICDWFNQVQAYCYAEDPSILLGQSACHKPEYFDYYLDHIQGLKWFPHHGYTDWPANSGTSDETILSRAEDLRYLANNYRARTPKEMREMWYAKHSEWLDAINIETNMNSGYDNTPATKPYYETYGTDPRMQQIFGAVYWAEITRTRVLEGAKGAVWYEYLCYDLTLKGCQGGYGLGMINMYAPFEKWFPYYVNFLYGNNLAEGDKIYESSSSDFKKVSSLAWKHGADYKLLLIGKTTNITSVEINSAGIEALGISVQTIEGTEDPENIVGSIKESSTSTPLKIRLNGYSVVLLTISV